MSDVGQQIDSRADVLKLLVCELPYLEDKVSRLDLHFLGYLLSMAKVEAEEELEALEHGLGRPAKRQMVAEDAVHGGLPSA